MDKSCQKSVGIGGSSTSIQSGFIHPNWSKANFVHPPVAMVDVLNFASREEGLVCMTGTHGKLTRAGSRFDRLGGTSSCGAIQSIPGVSHISASCFLF